MNSVPERPRGFTETRGDFHRDFHNFFVLEITTTYRLSRASGWVAFSFSRTDSGTMALTNTRSDS